MAVPDARGTAGRHRLQPTQQAPAGPGHRDASRLITPGPSERDPRDRAQAWLRGAMLALAVLAAAAAVVSWDAQYVLVRSVKHSDGHRRAGGGHPRRGALIFAALGIALALHGKHALRARTLNVGLRRAEPGHERARLRPRAGATWPSGSCPRPSTPWRPTP